MNVDTFIVSRGIKIVIYSKWIVNLVKIRLSNNIYYLTYSFNEYLPNGLIKEWNEVELSFNREDIKKRKDDFELKDLSPLPFKMVVTEVSMNTSYNYETIFKIEYINKGFNFGYDSNFDAGIKRQRETGFKERKVKKQKIKEKQKIEFFLLGTNHALEETIFTGNFIDYNNQFLLSFLNDSILSEDGKNERNRDPYLWFWEHKPSGDNTPVDAKISEFNGKNTISFDIPVEYNVFTGMTYLSKSFINYNYPINLKIVDNDNKVIYDKGDNENYFEISKDIS